MLSKQNIAPKKGQAQGLSLEDQVTSSLAVVWRELAWKHWREVFSQARTTVRAIDVLGGMMFAVSTQKTVTASIRARGQEQRATWDPDYSLFSKAVWTSEDLFHGVFKAALDLLPPEGPIVLAVDDTHVPKSGGKPKQSSTRHGAPGLWRWVHNPLAPPWETHAMQWGYLMHHAVLVIPTRSNGRSTGITVAFEPVVRPPDEKVDGEAQTETSAEGPKRKKGRPTKAEAAAKAAAKANTPESPLKSTEIAARTVRRVRSWLDEAGLAHRLLIVVGDNSFTNQTIICDLPDRTSYVGRTRPDNSLQFPGKLRRDGSYTYGEEVGNLRNIARNPDVSSSIDDFWVGGDLHPLKTKVFGQVYRKSSTRKIPLMVIILVPRKYGDAEDRNTSHAAFLLTTDFTTPREVLIQAYLDRWSIEICHRDMKSHVGVGQAQVSSEKSIRRLHAAVAASWALLQVAALKTCGEARTDEIFGKLPRWQAQYRAWWTRKRLAEGKSAPVFRPTAPDVLGLFRKGFGVDWTNRQVRFRL
ncbi:MAG: transposase [Acidobacteria bacterium]|nr:transposase [Acidobacteriota bacterium]